ncbi:SCO family protein [Candidatus Photodesmus blepharus]|uniref:SCO family protein n=1 Tax=Candidatus Photodesmus blepharonis TaxID=1179155 RepID=UPI0005579CF7|nr:SCO family protein [Candidatus Photodesmus blepharus]
MSRHYLLVVVVFAFVLGLGFRIYLEMSKDASSLLSLLLFGKDENGTDIFDLQDTRIRIVYFGFTRCPDICPTSLSVLATALNEIDEVDRAKLRPLFVSLDPEHDKANFAHQYAQYFHTMIEGFSAPLEVITELASRYGVIFYKTKLEGSQMKYTIDHSSNFYFLEPNGALIAKVAHTFSPDPLIETINMITNTKIKRILE